VYHQSIPPRISQAASQAMIANAHLRRAKAGSAGEIPRKINAVMGFARHFLAVHQML